MSYRLAAVVIPNLAIQIERERGQEGPLIITHPVEVDRVLTASPEVLALGVVAGMAVQSAQQMAPQARAVPASESAYHTRHEAARAALTAYAPSIETAALGEFLLDVRGLDRLHGDETSLAEQLQRVAHEATGLVVSVGLATGKFVAAVAARQAPAGGVLVVAAGREAEFVAPLPLEDLPLASIEVLRRLKLFDFKTLGDLAALHKAAVLRQFGPEFAELYELARGADFRPILPDLVPLRVIRSIRLPSPISDRAMLRRAGERAAWSVSKWLAQRGYSAEAVKATLYDEDGKAIERGVSVRPPTSMDDVLGRLVAQLIERMEARRAIASVTVCAYPLRPWHLGINQMTLAQAAVRPEQTRFETAVQALQHRFGLTVLRIASIVGAPLPLPVMVTLDPSGLPATITYAGQTRDVAGVDDQWREETNWWAAPRLRDYIRVILRDGSLRNLFRDLTTGEWFLDRAWPQL